MIGSKSLIAAPSSTHRFLRAGLALLLLLCVIAVSARADQAPTDTGHLDVSAKSGPKKHRKRQARPVKMGTSGGNVNDFTVDPPFVSCCSGTLGALLEKQGELYVLSNNHVLAKSNNAQLGDPVNQPGTLDNGCDAPETDFVATLSGFKKIKLDKGKNKVDAAIAAVDPGSVDTSGAIVGIGVPGDETVKPTVGMFVQKAGRTTGLRRGIVDTVNMSVFVEYLSECSSDATLHVARFVKQFRIVSATSKSFSDLGDSGSVILEDTTNCPAHVGLLFAGNQAFTIANPMSAVMKEVKKIKPKGKATMVGCSKDGSTRASKALLAFPEIEKRQLRLAKRIQSRTDSTILEIRGVHGIGISQSTTRPGSPVFKVLVDASLPEAAKSIPAEIEGVPVEVELSAPIRALGCGQRHR